MPSKLPQWQIVAAELFKAQFGLNAVEVKYKEPNGGITDMIGGNLSFIYFDTASVAAHLKSGKLRALAMTTKGRVEAMKDIPGSAEVGITNTDLYSYVRFTRRRAHRNRSAKNLRQSSTKSCLSRTPKSFLRTPVQTHSLETAS
jgi:tripartite-type tricarboxylate transporter receptor subunit TctC